MPGTHSSELDRLLRRCEWQGNCLLWMGAKTRGGYGFIRRADASITKAHRLAYELLVGPIPDGLHIDHVASRGCESRLCCNPAHLEPVTPGVNARRAIRGNALKE